MKVSDALRGHILLTTSLLAIDATPASALSVADALEAAAQWIRAEVHDDSMKSLETALSGLGVTINELKKQLNPPLS